MKNTYTIANKKFITDLIIYLSSIEKLGYIALDQGQVDSDSNDKKNLPIKFPALLIRIDGEQIIDDCKDSRKATLSITLRLITECNYYLNAKNVAEREGALLGYTLLEEIIEKASWQKLKYRGYQEINREASLLELAIQFEITSRLEY